jgi:serine/threonine-protein kinase
LPNGGFGFGAALADEAQEFTEDRLDRFELIAELAVGGMGAVYLARLGGAGGFQRLYAVKRLHDHLAKNNDFVSMFLDEARLAARIHHPNVVPIVEIGVTDTARYLVMEYIEGDTAWHLYNRAVKTGRNVPPRVSLRIALDCLAGLHAAHEMMDDDGEPLDLVHRDVSPHNILVGIDGVSRITDFGIARAATRLAVTQSGQLKGKLAYMAPEQARSEVVDRRADVFSMGICLWEMLAEKRLFKAEFEAETLNRLLYEPIPSLRSIVPSTPVEIEAVCVKALTRDPDKRFATAAEFADALEQAAKAFDLIGTRREVSACVDEILATDLAERRAAVKAWHVESDPNRTPPPSSLSEVGGTAASTRMVAPESSASLVRPANRALSWSVTVLAAGMAAATGLVEWRQLRAAGPAAADAVREVVTTTAPPAAPQEVVSQEVVPPRVASSAGPLPQAVPEPTVAESTAAAASEPAPPPVPTPTKTAVLSAAPSAPSAPLVAIRPARPVAAPAHVTPAVPVTTPAPSSLPQDMVVNPYR